jgi:tRNA (guanine-N(7)-)-methyltransferase subunit TRM82
MPKRPCAIAITEDDSTIVAADKFGDIYSLPLLFAESEGQQKPSSAGTSRTEPVSKPFAPAANELTVHSQRNRRALEHQKAQTNRAPEKFEPTFEHKVLLGHVSMLTDVAVADIKGRGYIISADRDEHIRISRGIPQSHIIEGFCLGHTEFVSRLCIPQGRSNLLISGGGDNELFVWDWLGCQLLSKTDLRSIIASTMLETEAEKNGRYSKYEIKVAVSNILHATVTDRNEDSDILFVTSEG